MASFLTGQKGASVRCKFCPGAVYTPLFYCMAVSVSVADLGAIATNDLGRFAVTREMVFKFIASETGYKFSELLLLALWCSYFGVEIKQAISDDSVGCFGVITYYFYDVEIVFYLVYLNVFYVWV